MTGAQVDPPIPHGAPSGPHQLASQRRPRQNLASVLVDPHLHWAEPSVAGNAMRISVNRVGFVHALGCLYIVEQ